MIYCRIRPGPQYCRIYLSGPQYYRIITMSHGPQILQDYHSVSWSTIYYSLYSSNDVLATRTIILPQSPRTLRDHPSKTSDQKRTFWGV